MGADKVTRICPTCGVAATERGHLCHPAPEVEPYVCEFCGAETTDPRHMCYEQVVAHIQYQCEHCGRLAVRADALCHPKKLV